MATKSAPRTLPSSPSEPAVATQHRTSKTTAPAPAAPVKAALARFGRNPATGKAIQIETFRPAKAQGREG